MTSPLAQRPDSPIKKLADVIAQGGVIFIVDAAFISPGEREQIERTLANHPHRSGLSEHARSDETSGSARYWPVNLSTLLNQLASKAHANGNPAQPPECPRPAYARLFEGCLSELGILKAGQTAPWAYWQALADGLDLKAGMQWLALEPCQWLVSAQQVEMRRQQPCPALVDDARAALEAGLERLKAELAVSPSGRGYLGFEQAIDLRSAWPESLEGLAVNDFLPQGHQARLWRQFSTEFEMALALKPDPSGIQSLWPWGLGVASSTPSPLRPAGQTQSLIEETPQPGLPLALHGFQLWMNKRGYPFQLKWRSFEGIQTVDGWFDHWMRTLTEVQAQRAKPSPRGGQSAFDTKDKNKARSEQPWAIILQHHWSYKVYTHWDAIAYGPRFPSLGGLLLSLRRFSRALLASNDSAFNSSRPDRWLLDLTCWQDTEADETRTPRHHDTQSATEHMGP